MKMDFNNFYHYKKIMSELKLSQGTIDLLLQGDNHEPRAFLGFHEILKKNNNRVWIVRVLEPKRRKGLPDLE